MPPSLDITLFHSVNQGMTNALFDVLMPLLSDRGFLLALPVLLAAGAAAWQRRDLARRPAFLASLTVLVPIVMFFAADVVNDLLKNWVARPRPCQALETVRLLVRCPRSFSMPSGHAIASFAFAVSLFILGRSLLAAGWRWSVLALAAMIALSRIYVGVHYPSDVLVGTLLGTALAAAVCIPLLRLYAPRPDGRQSGTS